MRDIISGCACFICILFRFDKKLVYPFMFEVPICTFIVMPMCCCAIGCQHSTLNRLFGFVFMVWRHYLRKVNKSSCTLSNAFLYSFLIFLMFLNIHIDLIILNKYDQQFILTTKKSLHIIFMAVIELHSTNVSWYGRLFHTGHWWMEALWSVVRMLYRPDAIAVLNTTEQYNYMIFCFFFNLPA